MGAEKGGKLVKTLSENFFIRKFDNNSFYQSSEKEAFENIFEYDVQEQLAVGYMHGNRCEWYRVIDKIDGELLVCIAIELYPQDGYLKPVFHFSSMKGKGKRVIELSEEIVKCFLLMYGLDFFTLKHEYTSDIGYKFIQVMNRFNPEMKKLLRFEDGK